MANEYLSGFSLESLVTPTKAAALYTAQEQSLFLSGQLVPIINVGAGSASAQVPLLGEVDATEYTDDSATTDLPAQVITDTNNSIAVNPIGARSVVRNAHGLDPQELGRVLGNAVAKKFDTVVLTAMATDFTDSTTDSVPMTADSVFDSVEQIRSAGEMGQLYGILSTSEATALMKAIYGDGNLAGGDFQTEALRNGYVGTFAGVQMFQSALVPSGHSGFIFGKDAARLAIGQTLRIDAEPRLAAMGYDLVAHMAGGAGVVDATRGIQLVNV